MINTLIGFEFNILSVLHVITITDRGCSPRGTGTSVRALPGIIIMMGMVSIMSMVVIMMLGWKRLRGVKALG